jgi:SulP family sulfate permease
MEGAVYFGAAAHVAEHLHGLRMAPDAPRHLLVMSKSMSSIDLAGADLWDAELTRRLAMGGGLYFHRPRAQVIEMWQRSGFIDRLGTDHIFDSKPQALAAIVPQLDGSICAGCKARIFEECARQPGAPVATAAG